MAILEVQDIEKNFSGLQVLTGVKFDVNEREKFAVLGPNGAGKTTLFNIISGKFQASGGTVLFKGRDISKQPPYSRARLGMARSFQITNLFQNLSVFENILAGVRSHRKMRHHMLRRPNHVPEFVERAEAILEQVGLQDERDTVAQELAYGQQRALELGVTLSIEPDLLLLDEPTAGMSRQETEEAIAMIDKVTKGKACIIIEHDMDVVFSLADRISVLHYGKILACGTPEEIRNDQSVKDAYLGEHEL